MTQTTARNSSRFATKKSKLALLALAIISIGGSISACHQTQPDPMPPAVETPAQSEATSDETATTEPAETGDQRASDTHNRFSIPLPQGWTAEKLNDDWLKVVHPKENIEVFVGVVPNSAPQDAIPKAWKLWSPDFNFEPQNVVDLPASDGLEKIVAINYDMKNEPKLAQAIGRQHQGHSYIFAFIGDMSSIQKRGAQINVIQSDLQIAALEKTDLSKTKPVVFNDAIKSQFDSFLQTQFERADIPGAAVAIVVGNEIVYSKGLGVLQKGKKTPVTPSTLMMIGSATKPMTTTMMARLVDQNLMQWDSPVAQLMPEFKLADKSATERVQMQHLVCACTGVPRKDLELILDASALNPQKIVQSLGTFELYTDFGETFQYSNQMIAAGGYAAAIANGATFDNLAGGYADAMQSHVFKPLGMTRTTVSFDQALADANHAMPHASGISGYAEPINITIERFVEPAAPAGAVWSSVEDVARFLSFQLQSGTGPDGSELVSAKNLAETHRPRVALSADTSYGLGWFVDAYKGAPVLHHGGNTMGFTTGMAFMPGADVGIVVLTNAGSVNWFPNALKTRLWELLYEQHDEIADKTATASLKMKAEFIAKKRSTLENVTSKDVATFLGTYTNADLGELTLKYTNGSLVADYGEGRITLMRLKEKPDHFEGVDGMIGGPFQLIQKDGKPSIVLGMGATTYTFTSAK